MIKHMIHNFELKRLKLDTIFSFILFAGHARFVFNNTLEYCIKEYEKDKSFKISFFGLNLRLPALKEEFPFLKDAPSQVLQMAIKDLVCAYENFFSGRKGYPVFKSREKTKLSFRFPQHFQIDEANGRIKIPKIGWIQYRNSRKIRGKAKQLTIYYKCGKWYAAIQTEMEYNKPLPNGGDVGIDLGVKRLVTQDDGTYFTHNPALKKASIRLDVLQKQLSHKTRGSKNWQKAKDKLAKQYKKVTNIQEDTLHKVSTTISKNHAVVYVEDLDFNNLMKSRKGTMDNPGKGVKHRSRVNRAIGEQGLGKLVRMLGYKLDWNGGYLIKVDPAYTSQTCPECLSIDKKNRKTQSSFSCVQCGYSDNADKVAAINVKRVGRAQLACVVSEEVISPSTRTHRRV